MSFHNLNCNGIGRRDFLQMGLGGMLGLGFTDLLRASQPSDGKKVNCILVWLDGGPSHYETFDPKPDAPKEIRRVWHNPNECDRRAFLRQGASLGQGDGQGDHRAFHLP